MRLVVCAATIVAGLWMAGPARAAVPEDAFMARSTGDLVTLCSAAQTDPMYTPAINFCHGFAIGTYRTLVDVERGMKAKVKLFCPPATPPSRNEGIAAFVHWAGLHSDAMALPPTDGILAFLGDQYPCK